MYCTHTSTLKELRYLIKKYTCTSSSTTNLLMAYSNKQNYGISKFMPLCNIMKLLNYYKIVRNYN